MRMNTAVLGLVLSVGVLACRPAAIGNSAEVPVCSQWNWSLAVVEAQLVSFSPTEEYRLKDGTSYPLSRVVLEVSQVYKGSVSVGRLNAYAGHGIDALGNSEHGDMRNAKGIFWLRDLDGTLGYAGPGFSREEAPGTFAQTVTTREPKNLSRDDLRNLASKCATVASE